MTLPCLPLALQAGRLTQACCAQIRLCFGRKNKTLGGVFRQHATLALLQRNRDTQAALQLASGVAEPFAALEMGDESGDTAPDDDAADMEVDTAPQGQGRRGKHRYTEELKQLVVAVLQQGDFEALRSAKLAQEDLLRLLAAFNAADIHFA